ncbi:MAG: hypothetical protein N0E54_15730 [Candidatus Thiodiazotropha taylori]|nr:hypothetical protein [Candidatus Thiodiazotropha endolucinida]MCW4230189.1 hypothetical protein [Candidatus Thiodiazotropha taylori]
MKITWIGLLVIGLSLLASGCANLNSISRTTNLPNVVELNDGDSYKPAGAVAIHLDAKQRIAVSKAFGAFCAEPSPDALSAYAAALGGSVTSPGKSSVDLASQFGEGTRSIGLRTQSIQLMRDALYRVCEAYYSKALNSAQVMALHQRYQDILIGTLAIEQITGAVQAATGYITASGKASASGQQKQLQAELDEAKKNHEEKQETQKTLAAEKEKLVKDIESKETELTQLKKVYKEQVLYSKWEEAEKTKKTAETEKEKADGLKSIAQVDVNILKSDLMAFDLDLAKLKKALDTSAEEAERANLQKQIDALNKQIEEKQTELKNAEAVLDTQQKAYETKKGELAKAERDESAYLDELHATQKYKAVEKADAELKQLKTSLEDTGKAVAVADAELKELSIAMEALENDIQRLSSQSGVFAETSIQANQGLSQSRTNIHDAASMKFAASAVKEIVNTVVNKERVVDQCIEKIESEDDKITGLCKMLILGTRHKEPTFKESVVKICFDILTDPSMRDEELKASCRGVVRSYNKNLVGSLEAKID